MTVSIHAPARGATASNAAHNATAEVSIHAPARGATKALVSLFLSNQFQSTRPRGARQILGADGKLFDLFQSTRPRGARQPCVLWNLWPR